MTPSRFVHGFNLLKGLNMRYFACTLAISFALCASSAHSQTFRTLLAFTGTSGAAIGAEPQGSLISDGTTLYGMTLYGGVNSYGNVFSVATDGSSYHNLLSFTGTGGEASGALPYGNLTLSGTVLYGMTSEYDTGQYGNIFSVATNGTNYQNILSFTANGGTASGQSPFGGLTLSGTTFYGATFYGGGSNGVNSDGFVFSVGTNGTNYQHLVSFNAGSGGKDPQGRAIARI